ncbi:MAG: outer membrane protein assembly factor BamD [Brevinematia bacterium]
MYVGVRWLAGFIIILTFSGYVYGSIAKILFDSGLNAYNRGDFQTAIEKLEVIFNEYPESSFFPKASMYLGYIFYEIGEYDKAKRYLLVSIRTSSKGSEVWMTAMKLLGVIYHEKGEEKKYEKVFLELQRYQKQKEIKLPDVVSQPSSAYISKRVEQPDLKAFTNYFTNWITNYFTNEIVITNQITQKEVELKIVTNYVTNVVTNYQEVVSEEVLSNLVKVKEKAEEVSKKEEDLEELNRLTDIKTRLLKLNEKALLIQELLKKKVEGKK